MIDKGDIIWYFIGYANKHKVFVYDVKYPLIIPDDKCNLHYRTIDTDGNIKDCNIVIYEHMIKSWKRKRKLRKLKNSGLFQK